MENTQTITQGIDDLPSVLTIPEAAKFLRIGRSSAYEAARTGAIPAVRVGHLLRVPRERLRAWLEEQNHDTD